MSMREENLAVIVLELIRRMSPKEKIELMWHISWQELEEWKATQETLSDSELMTNLKQGLKDEQTGGIEKVERRKGHG